MEELIILVPKWTFIILNCPENNVMVSDAKIK